MKTIPQAFQSFLDAIEVTKKQRSDANAQQARIRTALQKRLNLEDIFLSGSYSRKTAVRPLHDIDIFMVLKPERGFDTTVRASTILGKVKQVLDEDNHGKSALSQNRSVHINFSGTGVSYDIVPAFRLRDDVYQVPDRCTGRWIKSNPKVHKQLAKEANERAGAKLKPLVKALKHINNHHGKPARSFHLEVLSWKILKRDPGPFLDGLVILLKGCADRICDPCVDPANLGPDIRPESDRCDAAKSWLLRMTKLAAEAKALDDAKQTPDAHAKLRDVFGPLWPS